MNNRSLTTYAGIDPGQQGAAVVIDGNGVIRMAQQTPWTPKGYDLDGMLSVCQRIALFRPAAVGLEKVGGRPTDGGSRAFKFGEGYGYWRMGLHVFRVRYEAVSPQLWKGRLGLFGGDKRASVERARKEFPDAGDLLRYVKDDGIAEALLIAHFLRTRSVDGLRQIVEEHGKDSPQALTAILGGLNSKNRRLRGPK